MIQCICSRIERNNNVCTNLILDFYGNRTSSISLARPLYVAVPFTVSYSCDDVSKLQMTIINKTINKDITIESSNANHNIWKPFSTLFKQHNSKHNLSGWGPLKTKLFLNIHTAYGNIWLIFLANPITYIVMFMLADYL